jgi:hypothetical protein
MNNLIFYTPINITSGIKVVEDEVSWQIWVVYHSSNQSYIKESVPKTWLSKEDVIKQARWYVQYEKDKGTGNESI